MTARATTFADAGADFFAGADRARLGLLPPDGGAAVLEIGCGAGATGALALKQRRCASWIGVEANARQAAEALFALTDVLTGGAESVDLPDGPFDVIFVGQALSRESTLAALVGRMAAGGWLYLNARGDPLPAWMSPKTLAGRLRRAGLSLIVVKGEAARRRLFRPSRYSAVHARGRKAG